MTKLKLITFSALSAFYYHSSHEKNRITIHILLLFAAWACVACGKSQASPQTKDDIKYEVGIYEVIPFSEANFPAYPQYDDYQKAKEIEEALPYRDFMQILILRL